MEGRRPAGRIRCLSGCGRDPRYGTQVCGSRSDLIRDEADYARHVEYCWINPLKHGLVARVRDWPHSSFHRDVRAGLVSIDWGGEIETGGDFGERR